MRAFFALPLLLLAACGEQDESKPGMSTNIVDEQASYDVGNLSPADDETLIPANEGRSMEADSGREGAANARMETIPAALQGSWTGLNDRCGDRSAELELKVTADSLIFHESVGAVQGVASGPGGRVRVDAAFTGEGESWTKKIELRPSANGNELIIINDGAAVTRKRC